MSPTRHLRGLRALVLALIAPMGAACAPPPAAPPPPPPPPPPAAAEVPPPEPIALPIPVRFATGTATLAPDVDEALAAVIEYLRRSPETTLLRIEAHTDSIGGTDKNQRLSEDRALAVADWLAAHGVDCRRLLPVGFGESQPVASNDLEAGRSQNRRTVFVGAAIKGRNVDTDPAHGGRVAGEVCAGRAAVAATPGHPFQQGQLWVGIARCRQGNMPIRLRIEGLAGVVASGVMDFGTRDAPPDVPEHGSHRIAGGLDLTTKKAEFRPGEWIEHPPGTQLGGLFGELSSDNGDYAGATTFPGCSTFSLKLQK